MQECRISVSEKMAGSGGGGGGGGVLEDLILHITPDKFFVESLSEQQVNVLKNECLMKACLAYSIIGPFRY